MAEKPLYRIPISERPKTRQWIPQAILFGIIFNLGCLSVHGTQWLLQPLRLLFPFVPAARVWYDKGIEYTKAAFGSLLVFSCQFFAPCKFVITYEGSEAESDIFVRDASGNVTNVNLPDKLVIMANHQMYCDWMYMWCLTYFMNAHDQVLIILKKSLKHLPVVGWGMQFYRFLFLARSWTTDKTYLGRKLIGTAERAKSSGKKLSLFIFPEGTLVSRDTRPLSKKFADKIGINDMNNTLLPRSTGLQFLLRSMAPSIPDLQILDVTVGYPGVPPRGYGQDFYTLRSVFFQRIPPPEIHLHLRLFKQSEVPFGQVSSKDGVGRGAEATPEEVTEFEQWLRTRWVEKDEMMDAFYRDGKFPNPRVKGVKTTSPVEIPVRLRNLWEAGNGFCFFAPLIAWYVVKKIAKFVGSL